MKRIALKHRFESRDRAIVYATMLDFRRFGMVHPLMTSVVIEGLPKAGVTTYFVEEKAKIGAGIHLKPKYRVYVSEPIAGQQICFEAKIMGILRLKILVSFSDPAQSGLVDLIEEVEITQIPLLTSMFLKVFKKAHTEAFAKLRSQMAVSGGETQQP